MLQSSLDGSQGFYCALIPCQQCQRVCVCDWASSHVFTSLKGCTQPNKPDTDPAETGLKPQQPKGNFIWMEPKKSGLPPPARRVKYGGVSVSGQLVITQTILSQPSQNTHETGTIPSQITNKTQDKSSLNHPPKWDKVRSKHSLRRVS